MGKGMRSSNGVQEVRRGLGGGLRVNFEHVPARDHIAGGEVMEPNTAGRAQLLGVESDQIAGLAHGPKSRLSGGPRAPAEFAPLPGEHGEARRFDQQAAPLQIGQETTHHGSRKQNILFMEQTLQLGFAPARILAAQSQHRTGLLGGPRGPTQTMWTMRMSLQCGQDVWIIAAPPTVEALTADAEMPTRESRIASMLKVVSHPLKPPKRVAA